MSSASEDREVERGVWGSRTEWGRRKILNGRHRPLSPTFLNAGSVLSSVVLRSAVPLTQSPRPVPRALGVPTAEP